MAKIIYLTIPLLINTLFTLFFYSKNSTINVHKYKSLSNLSPRVENILTKNMSFSKALEGYDQVVFPHKLYQNTHPSTTRGSISTNTG